RVDRFDERRHQVVRAFGCAAHVRQRGARACPVAPLAERARALDLLALDRRVDALDLHREAVLPLVELVPAAADLPAAFDLLLRAVGGLADLVLHPAALDRGDRAA